MKKMILIILLTVINSVSAQDVKERFTIKAAANSAFFSGNKSNWKGGVGYQIGLSCAIPLTKKLSFSPELDYVRIHANSNRTEIWPYYGNYYITVEEQLRMSIISLPLLFKYQMGNHFNLQLGPQINYIAYANRERTSKFDSEKPNAYIKDFDFGPSLGLGYHLTSKWSIEAHYFLGLLNLDQNPGAFNAAPTNTDLGKMSIANLSIGYQL